MRDSDRHRSSPPPMDAAMAIDADENDVDPSPSPPSGPMHQNLAPEDGTRDATARIRPSAHNNVPVPKKTEETAQNNAAGQLVAPSTTIYATSGSSPNRHHPRRHRQYATPHPDYYAHAFGSGDPSYGNAHSANDGRWRPPRTPGKLAQILAAQLPPLHEPRYHHAATMFAALVLTSALAFCSGFDAYMRCGSVDYSMYFSERWTDDDGVAQEVAGGENVADGDGDDDAYAQNGDDDAYANNDDGGNNYNNNARWRWLEEQAADDAVAGDDQVQADDDVDEFDDKDNENGNDANYFYSHDNSESCDETFKEVLVPATIVGVAVGVVALLIVAFPRKRQPSTKADEESGDINNGGAGKAPNSADSSSESDAMRRLKSRQQHLVQCLQLFVMSCLALAAWVYGIVFLMLEPRGGYNDNYKSLAAVDGWGRVGDNANLYFSVWASLGLTCGLVYELAGMSLLQWRSTRQAAEQAAESIATAPSSGRRHNEHSSSSCNACPTSYWVETAASVDSYLDTESTKAIETVLDWSSAQVEEEIRDSRTTWYNSLYKLRARTGIWVSTLIASLILCATSARMWRNIIVPAAEVLRGRSYYVWYGSTDVCDVFYVMDAALDSNLSGMDNGDEGNDYDMEAAENYGWSIYDTNGVNYQTCTRTELAGTAGLWCSILSAIAIIAHGFMRRHAAAIAASLDPSQHSVHDSTLPTPCGSIFALPTELGLSMLNSLVLGSSAIFVTGVQGPAQRVGNLYFSIWLAFLLSLRIAVACLEQMFNVDDEEELLREQTDSAPTMMACGNAIESEGQNPAMAFKQLEYDEFNKDIVAKVDNTHHDNIFDHSLLENAASHSFHEQDDAATLKSSATEANNLNERPKRLRRWGSLAVFSSVCAAAAYDAGQNEPYDISTAQRYMFVLPLSVASLCYIVFAMCLNDITYILVDDFKIGGFASIITFLSWLSNIVVTMHSKTSFAVNSIGEIKFANLYFFSWFSMIIAGLQMKTYTTKRLGMKPKNLVLIMWFAIVKVTFVMFGAGLHIWLNIADTCKISNGAWQKQPLSFCNRTAFAVAVGITGTVIAFVIMIFRALRKSSRAQVYVEMFLSGLFVIIFGVAAFIITSIGGPGQSVGDLYIATWLSFLVSIGVCISCYDELLRDTWMHNRRLHKGAISPTPTIELATTSSTSPMEIGGKDSTAKTPYQRMDG